MIPDEPPTSRTTAAALAHTVFHTLVAGVARATIACSIPGHRSRSGATPFGSVAARAISSSSNVESSFSFMPFPSLSAVQAIVLRD